MYVMPVEFKHPHGDLLLNEFIRKEKFAIVTTDSSFVKDSRFVPYNQNLIDLITGAIPYWFEHYFNDKDHLLIYTEKSKEENKKLIENIHAIENPGFQGMCIVVCNTFGKED